MKTRATLAICAIALFVTLPGCSKGKNGGLEWKNTGKWADYYGTDQTMVWEVTNNNPKTVTGGAVCFYFYDAAGKQQAKQCQDTMGFSPVIKSGKTEESKWCLKSLTPKDNATVEAVMRKVEFDDGTSWEDTKATPETRPKGG